LLRGWTKFRLSAFLKITGSAQALDIVSFGCASIAQHEKFESKMAALGLVVNWIRAPCWMGCTVPQLPVQQPHPV